MAETDHDDLAQLWAWFKSLPQSRVIMDELVANNGDLVATISRRTLATTEAKFITAAYRWGLPSMLEQGVARWPRLFDADVVKKATELIRAWERLKAS
jgi:hypothetical protein